MSLVDTRPRRIYVHVVVRLALLSLTFPLRFGFPFLLSLGLPFTLTFAAAPRPYGGQDAIAEILTENRSPDLNFAACHLPSEPELAIGDRAPLEVDLEGAEVRDVRQGRGLHQLRQCAQPGNWGLHRIQ